MNEGSSNSASGSRAATPAGAATNKTPPPKPEVRLSEAEYLQEQARQAKQAMSRTLHLMGKNLGHSVDPRALARTHPLVSIGAATVGGFLLVNLVGRRRSRIWRDQFASIPPPPEAATSAPRGSAFSGLLRLALRTARPIIVSAISSALQARVAPATDFSGHSSNGHGEHPGAPQGPSGAEDADAGPTADTHPN